MLPFRVGIGYDVHQLVAGRKMVLGGVTIPCSFGPDGHSDADVLLHAIADALLGALALGDIGLHFPPSDHQFKDIDSMILLEKVYQIVVKNGYVLGNLDSVVVIQEPKISSYIASMRAKIADCLHVNIKAISIKATTTERLGFEGRGEGVSSYATAMLVLKS
jgi:2-C-methyl-D-erythritol 2,4-cyclodiphosphate synthase